MKKRTKIIVVSVFIGCLCTGFIGYFVEQHNQLMYAQNTLEKIFTAQSTDDLQNIFDSSVLSILPLDYLLYLVVNYNQYYGTFQNVSITRYNSTVFTYTAYFGNASTTGALSFKSSTNNKVTGFVIQKFEFYNHYIKSLTWPEIYSQFNALPGNSSLLIANNNNIMYQNGTNKTLQVGSSFKLFVLKALETNITDTPGITWNTEVAIRDQWKALPSGILQNVPAGTLYTLRELSNYMINISDNTAADHIIQFLGRDYVEKFFPSNYSFPLVTPGEMFKLRYLIPDSNLSEYLAMNETQKENYLDTTIDKLDVSDISLTSINWTANIANRKQIEWSFTTNQLYSILNETKTLNQTQMNPGLANPSDWSKVSYKGGGDVGVLSMAHALQSNSTGNWFYVVMIVNNYSEFKFNYGDDVVGQTGYYAICQIIIDKLALES